MQLVSLSDKKNTSCQLSSTFKVVLHVSTLFRAYLFPWGDDLDFRIMDVSPSKCPRRTSLFASFSQSIHFSSHNLLSVRRESSIFPFKVTVCPFLLCRLFWQEQRHKRALLENSLWGTNLKAMSLFVFSFTGRILAHHWEAKFWIPFENKEGSSYFQSWQLTSYFRKTTVKGLYE